VSQLLLYRPIGSRGEKLGPNRAGFGGANWEKIKGLGWGYALGNVG